MLLYWTCRRQCRCGESRYRADLLAHPVLVDAEGLTGAADAEAAAGRPVYRHAALTRVRTRALAGARACVQRRGTDMRVEGCMEAQSHIINPRDDGTGSRTMRHIAQVAISHRWPYCTSGHIAQVAILHRWPYRTGGHIAQVAILHRWPYRTSGHTAHMAETLECTCPHTRRTFDEAERSRTK